MVRTIDENTSVMGTFENKAKCEASLASLKHAYAPGSRARVAGRRFGERSCTAEWPK